MGFSRQEYWSGVLFPTPGDLSDPVIKPKSAVSPALQGDSLPPEPPGKLVVASGLLLPLVGQSLSHAPLFAAPCTAARQASLSFTISQSLLRFMSIESVMLPKHLILCCSLLLPPSIFLNFRVFPAD